MNSKKTFTTERLENIISKAIQNRTLGFAKYPSYKLTYQKLAAPFKKYLPYFLDYKNFEKIVFFFTLTIFFTALGQTEASATSSFRRSDPMVAFTSMQIRTETGTGAEVCRDCLSRSPQSSSPYYISELQVVRDNFAQVHNIAIYGRDRRQAIMDLRLKNPQKLNTEERVALKSAPKTGNVGCSSAGSNATLIRLEDGHDAIITSAHSFVDEAGRPRCDLNNVGYMPNVSFDMGGDFDSYTLRVVATNGELPLNLENARRVNGRIPNENDFLIFILSENVSQDILPDGSRRGFMKIASDIPISGQSYLVGTSVYFRDGASHYDSCEYLNDGVTYYHDCATEDTSSSSALTQIIDGEMVLTGIHSKGYKSSKPVPKPKSMKDANEGVSMDSVRRYLNKHLKPVIVTIKKSI